MSNPSPAERPGPPGRRQPLTDGQLFVPEALRPPPEGPDLVLHLHGAAPAAEANLARSLPGTAVGVTVTLPGLSSSYARKFRDPAVYPRILAEAARALRAEQPAIAGFRRVFVTSFSAGFGGVREILKEPDAFAGIHGLVLADSLHAGLSGDGGERSVDAAAMEGFLRFAREARQGRRALIITHSEIRTPGYASTTETADYLLGRLGGTREAADRAWPGGLRLTSRFRSGRFEVLGFAGDTGADHLLHLHALWSFLRRAAGDQGSSTILP